MSGGWRVRLLIYKAAMSRCRQERMCLMTGRQGCPAEAAVGTHFKAAHWQRGMLVIGLLLCLCHPTPASHRVPAGTPQCSVQEALMS